MPHEHGIFFAYITLPKYLICPVYEYFSPIFFVNFESKMRNNLKSNFPCSLRDIISEKREKILSTLERKKKKLLKNDLWA